MKIQHRTENSKGIFFIQQDGKQFGQMVYSLAGNETMVIEHTEVISDLGGKGIGKQLVEAGVNYARLHHYRILPLCSFAKVIMNRNAAYQDVLVQ
ncbi:MAG: GNAT family N-acetyltransferase [Sphingobacteriaceae bacterium]